MYSFASGARGLNSPIRETSFRKPLKAQPGCGMAALFCLQCHGNSFRRSGKTVFRHARGRKTHPEKKGPGNRVRLKPLSPRSRRRLAASAAVGENPTLCTRAAFGSCEKNAHLVAATSPSAGGRAQGAWPSCRVTSLCIDSRDQLGSQRFALVPEFID